MSVITLSAKLLSFLELIGLVAIIGGIVAGTFFFGGFFSVAANHPDPEIVDWTPIHAREASIARQATGRAPESLDDPALVRADTLAYSQKLAFLKKLESVSEEDFKAWSAAPPREY